MTINKDGKGRTKVKVNNSGKEQGLRMQKRNKMWHHKRGSIQLNRDMGHSSSIEVRALVSWSVRHVVRNTLGEIVHRTVR